MACEDCVLIGQSSKNSPGASQVSGEAELQRKLGQMRGNMRRVWSNV